MAAAGIPRMRSKIPIGPRVLSTQTETEVLTPGLHNISKFGRVSLRQARCGSPGRIDIHRWNTYGYPPGVIQLQVKGVI